eukprot:739318-Alexandrium_andersonii.AAC.1
MVSWTLRGKGTPLTPRSTPPARRRRQSGVQGRSSLPRRDGGSLGRGGGPLVRKLRGTASW